MFLLKFKELTGTLERLLDSEGQAYDLCFMYI